MVEVTQEDREAAASIAVLVEMRELIREGRADHHAEPFARHRIAAENAAMEEFIALRARIEEDQAQIVALTTYKENLRDEVIELRARIAELEACIDLVIPDDCKSQLHEDATNLVKLQARVAELEAFQQQAITQVCELAREAGEAKGKLEASELPGIVDGWREKCERLERRVAELEKERSQG